MCCEKTSTAHGNNSLTYSIRRRHRRRGVHVAERRDHVASGDATHTVPRCPPTSETPCPASPSAHQAAQSTTISPGTRSNSRALAVTGVVPARRAWAAISTS
jgi:hypothetical protein